MAKSDDKKAKPSDADRLKALKKKLKKLKASVKDAAAGLESRAGSAAEAAVAAIKAAKPTKLVSPLAPARFPDLPVIEGAEFASGAAGIKYQGRTDVMLVRLAPGTAIAGAFTRSSTRAACVLDCQAKLDGKPDASAGAAIIVNSGNANAFTGKGGQEAVDSVTGGVAKALGLPRARVFSSSTGVIGEPLPAQRITAIIGDLAARLDPAGAPGAARAIMTTDTFAKGSAASFQGEGGTINIVGIAKGSGMIAPDMATMLVYIFTDAKIAPAMLQRMLSARVDET
ncbi:MAG: bifunctional ornithine acetyltransferase/N-acetylglutamate synthase, partial [Paracoccus sp.]|nr:bifunctional ornithine acetyltransferase/N-acetylglutamate synthase [Paracoccus sp. (in: a-proteobacteria)]